MSLESGMKFANSLYHGRTLISLNDTSTDMQKLMTTMNITPTGMNSLLHCPSCCKTSTNNTNAAVLQGHITLYVFEGNWPHNNASWFQQFSHDEGWEVVFLACHLAHPSQACPQKYQENSKLMKFSTNGNWMSYQLIVACFIDNPICILWTVLFIK